MGNLLMVGVAQQSNILIPPVSGTTTYTTSDTLILTGRILGYPIVIECWANGAIGSGVDCGRGYVGVASQGSGGGGYSKTTIQTGSTYANGDVLTITVQSSNYSGYSTNVKSGATTICEALSPIKYSYQGRLGTGDITYKGGDGSANVGDDGGGGGEGASTTANGNDAIGTAGGTGGDGGDGGVGSIGSTIAGSGSAGGGAGGGSSINRTCVNPINNWKAKITYWN